MKNSFVSIFLLFDIFGSFDTRGGGEEGDNSLYFVWYRRDAGIAPICQVIYTPIGHDFILTIHL